MIAMATYFFAVGCAGTCASWVSCEAESVPWSLMARPLLQQVDQREDRDPDDVDEVPVETADLHVEVVLRSDPPGEGADEQRPQPEYAHADVRAVEARQDVERAGEQVRLQGEALVDEMRELVRLEPD